MCAAPTTEYRIKLRRLHPAQQAIRDSLARYNVLCLGRRTGKTVFGLDSIIDPVLLDGYPAAWFAPKYKYTKEVYLEACQFLKPLIARKDGSELRIELVTGGVLEFWTLEDPDAGRGRKYKRMIVDEAAMARHLQVAWEQSLQATLMDYRGDAFFLSTPKGIVGPGAFFKELFDRGQAGHANHRQDWRSWQMPTAANPYIHPDEIENMRRDMPELVFQQEVLAQFVDFGGTMVKREWLQTGSPPPLSELRVYMAVDLAISLKEEADFTAIAVVGIDASGRIWILHLERAKVTFHDSLQLISRVANRWRPLEIGVESVQYQAAAVEQLLRTTTLPVRPVRPDRDKLVRFQPMQVRYQNRLVWHADGLIPEWEDELLSFPLGDHDDMVDAVGYAFSLAGEFGRTQFIYPEADPKEAIVQSVTNGLPGLPAPVAETLAELRSNIVLVGDVCGRCDAFEGGMCSRRGFFVGANDPGCIEFMEVEVPEPEPAPEAESEPAGG